MGVQDHSPANVRPNEQDLDISAAAPVVRDESKPSEAAVALETRSSTSESQDLGDAEKLKDRQKGIDNLEKAIPPPYTTSDTASEQAGEVNPFGHEDENAEIKYQTMEWWHAGLLMVAENISLGVLSLPQAVAVLGLFPGIFMIVLFGLISSYSAFVIGQFYLKYPGCHTFADAAFLIAGPIAREIMGVAQVLILIFIQAAHLLTFTVALNVLSNHGTCTIAFGIVGFGVCFILSLKRQLEKVSYLSVLSCISILICVTLAMIGIGITKPNAGAVVAVNAATDLQSGVLAFLNIILAYAGHVAFFTFCSELKNPRDFPKSVAFMHITATSFYVVVGVVIYYYAGADVKSPALGSASPIVAKVAYGLALPTIVIAGVVCGHVACKYVWVRCWRHQPHRLHHRRGWPLVSWIAIVAVGWLVAWIIAEAIPSFSLLLGLISALFCSWFSFGFSGGLWLWMNRGRYTENWKKCVLTVVNVYMLCQGAAICGLGLWASGSALAEGQGGAAFSCADNS
ncbi:putative neutral amino acid permease [Diplodia seriata]|uniref:Putative neutral amino acid permease n=1 Tax=Diplodia seriata TaxID=420778 RepID=A0A0G2DV36_9PEZI|nr:putative neutral amino acid permease [Diplodia seriata]